MKGWVVYQHSIKNRNQLVYLVDRKIVKSRWWTTDIAEAIIFQKLSAANIQANKLRHNKPGVMEISEALKNTETYLVTSIENSFHPHDPYSLGQE